MDDDGEYTRIRRPVVRPSIEVIGDHHPHGRVQGTHLVGQDRAVDPPVTIPPAATADQDLDTEGGPETDDAVPSDPVSDVIDLTPDDGAGGPGEERLTVQEAARSARKTDRTVRRWISSGRLPAVQVNGAYTVSRADLDEFIEELEEAESARPTVKRPAPPAGLIPIETVTTIIEEMSRLHRDRTDAIERAARAEERERFQSERRRLAEERLAENERIHALAEAARQADLPAPPDMTSDAGHDDDDVADPEVSVSDIDPSERRPGRVRTAWRALWT